MSKEDDAYKYWQSKLKSGDKTAKAAAASASDDDDAELDEDFSGSEVKFSQPSDEKDDDYSMNDDDDFAISTSFKQAPGMDRTLSTQKKKNIAASGETASAAKDRLSKILEEEKKQARDEKLRKIMDEQKKSLKKNLGDDSDEDSDSDDSDEEEKKPSTIGAKPKTSDSQKKKASAVDYFMKKAGKDVEESSEISMEEDNDDDQVPIVENSGTSIGAGLVAAKPKKVAAAAVVESEDDDDFSNDGFEDSDDDQKPPAKKTPAKVTVNKKDSPKAQQSMSDDDDFDEKEVEKPTQSMNVQKPSAPARIVSKPKPEPVAQKSEHMSEEESIADDFVEESINDEMQASQSFSVHDGDEESKDKVLALNTKHVPGNSTVNMASVVPMVKVVQPANLDQTRSPQMQTQKVFAEENTSSPMFVKAKAGAGSPDVKDVETGSLDSSSKRPMFVKHNDQIDQKPVNISRRQTSQSPSPSRKKREEDEINEQLKQIQPRYPQTKSQKPKGAIRPQTAKPVPATQARVASNNRDLTKVSVPQKNNFTSQSSTQNLQTQAKLNNSSQSRLERKSSTSGRPQSSQNNPVVKRARPTSAIAPKQNAVEPAKKEKINYAEVTLAQPPEEKKFFKYEPRKSKLPLVVAPPPKPRKPKTEVVVDEADDVKVHSQSPQPRGAAANADISAVVGLATRTTGSSAIPVLNASQPNPFDIVASIKETIMKAADRKKAAVTKPGSSWGSRIVPDNTKKYELPTKVKPKVKEETKTKAKQASKLGTLKKEELFVKEKNPGIPSHKVAKKPEKAIVEGQENIQGNKPKVAAKGATNVVVQGGSLTKGSINAFDPIAAMGGNKKIKEQIKQQKLPSGRPQSGVAKNKKAGGTTEFKMPSKNRGFDNDDLGSMFGEDNLLAGDQGAPTGNDDFGADDLLAGDQHMNMEAGSAIMQDEFDDDDADEDDKNFLKEVAKPKPSQQKLARQATNASQKSAKRETQWAGNGLGSGSLQQQQKKDNAEMARKPINMALQPAKKQAEPKPIAWGFNAQKTKVEVNKEEEERKQKEAKEKFKDLQHQKKLAAQNANPSLNVFMAQMTEMDKKSKKDAKKNAINPLIKNGQVNEVNPQSLIKSGADRVPAEAGNVNDTESNCKQIQDLKNELKQLFYENKKTNKQVQQIDRRKITVQAQLEQIMIERSLVRENGKLKAKTDFKDKVRRLIDASDVPDYDKIADRANPLEPVVQKFAERGFTPLSVFTMLDIEDEDDILTFDEIKNGLKRLKITLLDTEWQTLFKAIDKDGDGTVTIDEWQEILQPKLNAQREFINIMKGLNINDPLLLEEQILDTLYQKRHLAGEVKVMRRTKNQEQFFRKKQVQQEQKAMADKIKQLQDQVKNSRERTEEERLSFDEKMKSGLQTKADVEAEYEMLTKSKREIEIEQGYLEEEHRKELMAQDQLHNETNQRAIAVKQDRDRKKLELKKMTVRLEMQRAAEQKLDKELEAILGRAVTMEDLEALYQQDLKLLGAIEAGIGNKIGSLREIIMARYVQKAWRGYVARKQVKEKRRKRKEFMDKYNVFKLKSEGNRRERAARLIGLKWRARAMDKEFKKQRQENTRSNDNAKQKELKDQLTAEQMALLEKSAIVLQKNWRAYVIRRNQRKQDKNAPKLARFGQEKFDAFQAIAYKDKGKNKSKAVGNYNYHQERICIQCDEEDAQRQCMFCEDNIFCKKCFVESHIIGPKKRHLFFDITYNTELPEGPSTWAQPIIKMADVQERDSSFLLQEESDDSESSFERFIPSQDPYQAANIQMHRQVHLNPLLPQLNAGYSSAGAYSMSRLFGR